jgi:hypothetical protein
MCENSNRREVEANTAYIIVASLRMVYEVRTKHVEELTNYKINNTVQQVSIEFSEIVA